MPCYQPPEEYIKGYDEGVRVNASHHPDDKARIRILEDYSSRLEGMLCALINELERRDIAASVIGEASKKGEVDIHGFWRGHKDSDEAKMSQALNSMSQDEIDLLKKLLL